MNNDVEVEYTKRDDGFYNQWKKLSLVQLKVVDRKEFIEAGRPDYMNPKVWTVTDVVYNIPRRSA